MKTARPLRSVYVLAGVVAAVLLVPSLGQAQDLTPGIYWPLPNGLNILTVANSVNHGAVAFDPSLPIDFDQDPWQRPKKDVRRICVGSSWQPGNLFRARCRLAGSAGPPFGTRLPARCD